MRKRKKKTLPDREGERWEDAVSSCSFLGARPHPSIALLKDKKKGKKLLSMDDIQTISSCLLQWRGGKGRGSQSDTAFSSV